MKPKEWKKRKDAEDLVMAVQHEDLRDLLDVGADVVVGEHDALGVAGAAAGKDDGGEVVNVALAGCGADGFAQKSLWHGGSEDKCEKLFGDARGLQNIFEENGSAGNFQLGETLDKCFRRDDNFDFALFCAGGDDFA